MIQKKERERTKGEEVKEKEERDMRELTDFGKLQQCP